MKKTEEQMLQNITRLFADLETATYGDYKANGHVIPPNASRFYYTTKRLYEQVDILVKDYSPNYVSSSDYMCIYDSQRIILLHLDVLKDCKKLNGQELTWELEKYLTKLYGIFGCISTFCEKLVNRCL